MSELLAATHGTGNGWMYHDKPRYDDGDLPAMAAVVGFRVREIALSPVENPA